MLQLSGLFCKDTQWLMQTFYACSQWHTVIHISLPPYLFFLGLTIMFPITFRISFYSSEIPTYRKEIKGRKYNQSYGKLSKYLMNPAMSIHLLDKLDKLIYISR